MESELPRLESVDEMPERHFAQRERAQELESRCVKPDHFLKNNHSNH